MKEKYFSSKCKDETALEDIEIKLLLEAIFQQYGYDFRQYGRASITRRIRNFLSKTESRHISELIPLMLHNPDVFNALVESISVTVTEMFRDPFVYKKLREEVLPYLRTYPTVNIWVSGCATGEEVYSLAILLKEEGLYDKTQIFATDINKKSLAAAQEGIYPTDSTKISTNNYYCSGGKHSFNEYYFTKYGNTIMNKELKRNIVFTTHNLSVDAMFNKMQMIFCRNVLIYFNRSLQNNVLKLFHDSLLDNGFLIIGTKEDIRFSVIASDYKVIGENEKIYQKKRTTYIYINHF